ncbi:MAG: GNAT family N-acetyltransferase [Micromonosporaceae bacterium]|nr:GNAT family N-acetyltransferase [Micromonosporaceae bacterium]
MSQPGDEPAWPYRPWLLAVRDEAGAVVGAGMRTALFAPYPVYLLPMPDPAAVALAGALYERGEEPLAINGALPTIQICATELARLGGGRVEISQHTRLHELGTLVEPTPVPGRLVVATEDDLDLVAAWFAAFIGDADVQAGRPRGATEHEAADRTELLRRIRAGRLWFWVDEAGERVHLTGASEPSFGVARIGPVYTPPDQRGRGWASNAVADVSRRLLAEGARACLFTDQANPTANKIYTALGYRPVVDMANLVIVR